MLRVETMVMNLRAYRLTFSREPWDWERDALIALEPCFWQARNLPGLHPEAFLGTEVIGNGSDEKGETPPTTQKTGNWPLVLALVPFGAPVGLPVFKRGSPGTGLSAISQSPSFPTTALQSWLEIFTMKATADLQKIFPSLLERVEEPPWWQVIPVLNHHIHLWTQTSDLSLVELFPPSPWGDYSRFLPTLKPYTSEL